VEGIPWLANGQKKTGINKNHGVLGVP
jgi:hypothetical protein